MNEVEGQQDPYWWDENCDEMYAWLKENEDSYMVLKRNFMKKNARGSVKKTKKAV